MLDSSQTELFVQHLVKPRLRGVDCRQVVQGRDVFLQLYNREELSDQLLQVPQAIGLVLQYFDGARTITEIAQLVRDEHRVSIQAAFIEQLAGELDKAVLLDGPGYDAARDAALNAYRSTGIR